MIQWPMQQALRHFLNETLMRNLNPIDKIINQIDIALRVLCPPQQRVSQRPNPGLSEQSPIMSKDESRHVAGLMRVNHAGEVCAQALYQGQALTAKLTTVKTQMINAAEEEIDHLAWCEDRLRELKSHPSKLNVLWYSGSFLLGALAGAAGDKWSLGFVAETERQVAAHLQGHLDKVPLNDMKTRAILNQMHDDESHHADIAHQAGAAELPVILKTVMKGVSKLMTHSSYWI